MPCKPELLVEGKWGEHIPAIFCQHRISDLVRQDLADDMLAVLAGQASDHPVIQEAARTGWDNILSWYIPAANCHLEYKDGALLCVPDRWDWDAEEI